MRTLWLVGGSVEAVPAIAQAKKMGLRVVVSDGDARAHGLRVADHAVVASTYDVEQSVAAVEDFCRQVGLVDGVIAVGADVPVTVATIAAHLELPGLSLETAHLAADKLLMKACLSRAGIPVPWYSVVESPSHLEHLIAGQGYPLVLKPVDSRGARGVLRLEPEVELSWALQHSRSHSPTGRVMIEEYLSGPQVSTESLLMDGDAYTPGFSDRNYETLARFAPHVIEDGGEQPSRLHTEQRSAAVSVAEAAARALGILTGTAKGDLVMTSDGPKVIEIAARLSGGWFCTDQIPLATGVDFVGAAIQLALGEHPQRSDLIPRFQRGVAIRYFFPTPGRVLRVGDVSRWKAKPWVHRLMLFVRPGDLVEPVTNHTKRAGFVIASGRSREVAVERATRVVRALDIETAPR